MSERRGPGSPALIRRMRRLEWTCFGVGAALVLFFVGARLHSAVSRELELAVFDQARDRQNAASGLRAVDQTLWAEGRIAKYRESLGQTFAPPLAVLRVPKIGLEVPVLPGTDDLTLNRAVGTIPGTAVPGELGNVGIAGHRDGFFRGLKDIGPGDRLELETLGGKQEYFVTSIRIVDPGAIDVLAPTPRPTVTLVTCYPFYFIGNAPQRYIVRAEARIADGESEARQGR